MDITGKRVTVSVEGIGSKEGVVDRCVLGEHRMRPYHVAFDDGMSGWFDGEQVGLFQWSPAANATQAAGFDFRILTPEESAALKASVVARLTAGDAGTGTDTPQFELRFAKNTSVTARR